MNKSRLLMREFLREPAARLLSKAVIEDNDHENIVLFAPGVCDAFLCFLRGDGRDDACVQKLFQPV